MLQVLINYHYCYFSAIFQKKNYFSTYNYMYILNKVYLFKIIARTKISFSFTYVWTHHDDFETNFVKCSVFQRNMNIIRMWYIASWT